MFQQLEAKNVNFVNFQWNNVFMKKKKKNHSIKKFQPWGKFISQHFKLHKKRILSIFNEITYLWGGKNHVIKKVSYISIVKNSGIIYFISS